MQMRKDIYSYVIFIHWNLLKKTPLITLICFLPFLSFFLSIISCVHISVCVCLSHSLTSVPLSIYLSSLSICVSVYVCLSFFYSSPSLSISIYDVIIEVHNCLQCRINSQSLWGQCDHLTKTWINSFIQEGPPLITGQGITHKTPKPFHVKPIYRSTVTTIT